MTISNPSGSAQADNPGDEFTDTLPAGLTLVSADDGADPGVVTTALNSVFWNGAIPVLGSVTITINATVDAGVTGPIFNQGTISFDADGDGINESSQLTDYPRTAAVDDPTSLGLELSPLETPTLSALAALLLALALAGLGLWALRPRS